MDRKRIQAPAPHPRQAQMQNTLPTATPSEKDPPPDDDLVPDLPSGWQPPTFLTYESGKTRMPTSQSESSEAEEAKRPMQPT